MQRLVAPVLSAGLCVVSCLVSWMAVLAIGVAPAWASSATVPAPPGDDAAATTTLPDLDPAAEESGAAVPAPAIAASVPLVQIPEGCAVPPVASVVFVGRMIAKDYRAARYQIQQIRAGSAEGYAVGNLIDVRYGNDVEFLDANQDYLVGAVPEGADLVLTSKVRETKAVLGGNAIIGLTEKAAACPPIEDPVRTFHLDGSEIEAGMLTALSHDKRGIALAFAKPLLAVIAVIFALVLLRWLFTGIFAAMRRAAEAEPLQSN